jgi:acyl-CoA thioester hydrolase
MSQGGAAVCVTPVRVRYKDTDTMGVVYYGNYLTYFEVGRVEYLRQRGLPMATLNQQLHLPVAEASVKYVRPARLDELLEVRCWISQKRRASFQFAYDIRNEAGDVVATGHTLHACWDPVTSRMIPIPEWLHAAITVYNSSSTR